MIVINTKGFIVAISELFTGKVHDKTMSDTIILPQNARILADSGFQGLQKTYNNIILPIKKTKNKLLTKEQILHNKKLASERIQIEQVIGSIKILRTLKEILRCTKTNIRQLIFRIGASLHNLKVKNGLSFCS